MSSYINEDKVNEAASYVKDGAKEAQKEKMKEQLGSFYDKVNKWADKKVYGYEQNVSDDHKEGDVWEERGKQWTIKNGIKQTADNVDYSKARCPWFCPKCNRVMNHWLHEKFWRIRGACHDCVVRHETKMRIDGVWETYERRTMRSNEKSFLHDKMTQHQDWIDNFVEPTLYFQDGRYEKLASKAQFELAFKNLTRDIEFMKSRLEVIKKEEDEDKNQYSILEKWEIDNPWSTET